MSLKKLEEMTHKLMKVEENFNSEHKILEYLVELASDGYWDWDLVSNYKYLSPKLKSRLGYNDKDLEDNEAWVTLCDPRDIDNVQSELYRHLNGETDEFDMTVKFLHKNGKYVDVICKGKVIKRNVDGNPIRMVGTNTIVS